VRGVVLLLLLDNSSVLYLCAWCGFAFAAVFFPLDFFLSPFLLLCFFLSMSLSLLFCFLLSTLLLLLFYCSAVLLLLFCFLLSTSLLHCIGFFCWIFAGLRRG
jgi:hypothetical protein